MNYASREGGATLPPYLPELRAALRAKFAQISDAAQRARLVPMRGALKTAFDTREPESVIRQMVENADLTDNDYLNQLQQEMLALPQWTVTSQS